RSGVSTQRAGQAAQLLLPPLPSRHGGAAAHVDVPVEQHDAPADHRRYQAGAAPRRGQAAVLPKDETVPLSGIVEGDWFELAYRGEPASSRVLRTVYELCLFRALREQLRCKEIWV